MTQQTITTEQLQEYGKALAALLAGVFPYEHIENGRHWIPNLRIPFEQLDRQEAKATVAKLEHLWYDSPIAALAAAADALGIPSIFEGMTVTDMPQNYNEDDPADCLRVAVDWIKRAAGLCASACGALGDQDSRETAKYRPVLLRYRGELNNLAAVLEGKGGAAGDK